MKRQAFALIAVALLVMACIVPVAAADWKDSSIRNLTLQNWKDLVSNTTALRNGTATMTAKGISMNSSIAQIPSLNFTTPSAGTYLLMADIRENVTATNLVSGTYSYYGLCAANGTTMVTSSERLGLSYSGNRTNITERTHHFTWIYSNSTGSVVVGVCGKTSEIVTPATWTVDSSATGRSALLYLRLP